MHKSIHGETSPWFHKIMGMPLRSRWGNGCSEGNVLLREQKLESFQCLDLFFPAFGPLVVAKLRTEKLDFLQ